MVPDSSFQKVGLYNFQKFNLYEVTMIFVAYKDISKSIVPVDYIMSVSFIASFVELLPSIVTCSVP